MGTALPIYSLGKTVKLIGKSDITRAPLRGRDPRKRTQTHEEKGRGNTQKSQGFESSLVKRFFEALAF